MAPLGNTLGSVFQPMDSIAFNLLKWRSSPGRFICLSYVHKHGVNDERLMMIMIGD